MELPGWVLEAIRQYQPPFDTGEVEVVLLIETYKTGVTKAKIGGKITVKPPQK